MVLIVEENFSCREGFLLEGSFKVFPVPLVWNMAKKWNRFIYVFGAVLSSMGEGQLANYLVLKVTSSFHLIFDK